jgi:hypothetical protein
VTRIRLLPVVIMVIGALLVLKTMGLVTEGHYVLSGVSPALAAGGGEPAAEHAAPVGDITLHQPTLSDASPTMGDTAPTMGAAAPAADDHGGTAELPAIASNFRATGHEGANRIAEFNACAPRKVDSSGEGGQLTSIPADCPPLLDAIPLMQTPTGNVEMGRTDPTLTEQVLLDRLVARRTELEGYEQELAMRASLIDAAERRVSERATTLETLESQIATLVEEPKDAASIFNELDLDVLVRVTKMISPRKMAPILAAMGTARAQELTVRLASETSENPEQMRPADLAALPQIVGQ